MTRIPLVRGVSALLSIAAMTVLHGCSCPDFKYDQHDGVGGFISLSKTPLDKTVPVDVGPARIRARRGEKITWIFRNPSDTDVQVELLHVFDGKDDRHVTDIKSQIFPILPTPVPIPKDCGMAALVGQLARFIDVPADSDSCSDRQFHYYFKISGHDSLNIPYDPELWVEGQP